jgi:hypothetical protein
MSELNRKTKEPWPHIVSSWWIWLQETSRHVTPMDCCAIDLYSDVRVEVFPGTGTIDYIRSVDIKTMLWAGQSRGWGSFLDRGKKSASSPQLLSWLWDPTNFLHSAFWRTSSPEAKWLCSKLGTGLHRMPEWKRVELYLHFPVCLHGVTLK